MAVESASDELCAVEASSWPASYKRITRVKFTDVETFVTQLKQLAKIGEPVIFEGTELVDTEAWANMSHLEHLLQDKELLVKHSPNSRFRYFDLKKNLGNFEFSSPVEELNLSLSGFNAERARIIGEGSQERLYLQETLSGKPEMAQEFVKWNWELLIRTSVACGWGLPDSNELFIGMAGAETPLHFDERENLFFQVRGHKEVVVYPFVDYTRMYPFPTTHPCDRQSMVGDARNPNLDAFPKFRDAWGHYEVLKAGDLCYIPYGWWHWLRNLEELTTSISFWSTAQPTDLSDGVPDTFSEHMLSRVRRNLESMLAQSGPGGPPKHNETMLNLRKSVEERDEQNPTLQEVRKLLAAVRMEPSRQDEFILDSIAGRFGINWQEFV